MSGIGLYIEPQSMIGPYSTEPAHIRVQPDGTVDVYLGSGSHGQGLETTTAQLVSEFLGVPFDDVTVHQGDTNETPVRVRDRRESQRSDPRRRDPGRGAACSDRR